MIPYGHQSINDNDISEVVKALKSDWLTQGPLVSEFEKKLAGYCGVKYAVAVASGTAALHLSYLVAGLKAGDEVITTPNTFVATSNMLLVLGVKPVFCDIRLDSYNIDENKIEKLINRKTKAIVPVHFAGQPCAMAEINRLAKKYKLLVIEDACHALGAKYKNKKIGGLSDMSIFSFHPVKSITTGEGGAILTNNKKFYDRLVLLRSHGIHKDKNGKNVMTELGFNYRITDIQAALGLSQLLRLDSFIKKRHQIAKRYGRELKDVKQIILPRQLKGNYSAWHLYVIRTVKAIDRDKLAACLKKKGIGVNFHYPAVYSHPYYRQAGFKNFNLRNASVYCQTCISLPIYFSLSELDFNYVVSELAKAVREDK